MRTELNIHALANMLERLVETVYIRDAEYERIYFREVGLNTEMVKTTAYIHIVNGELRTYARVFGPSQHSNWRRRREQEAEDYMMDKVVDALAMQFQRKAVH